MNTNFRMEATTIIDRLLNSCPKLAEVFNGHGMACVGCVFSRFHTIADAATIYQLDPSRLLDELSHTWALFCEPTSEERNP